MALELSDNETLFGLDISIFKTKYLIVHSVEQYVDGFIIDLASNDKSHVSKSIRLLIDLIEHVSIL